MIFRDFPGKNGRVGQYAIIPQCHDPRLESSPICPATQPSHAEGNAAWAFKERGSRLLLLVQVSPQSRLALSHRCPLNFLNTLSACTLAPPFLLYHMYHLSIFSTLYTNVLPGPPLLPPVYVPVPTPHHFLVHRSVAEAETSGWPGDAPVSPPAPQYSCVCDHLYHAAWYSVLEVRGHVKKRKKGSMCKKNKTQTQSWLHGASESDNYILCRGIA